MKLTINEMWDENGATYHFFDSETGLYYMADLYFDSRNEAQEYLNAHRDEIEKIGLPNPSPDEEAMLWAAAEIIEKKLDAGTLTMKDWPAAKLLKRLVVKKTKLQEHELQRIESIITRVSAEANKAVLSH